MKTAGHNVLLAVVVSLVAGTAAFGDFVPILESGYGGRLNEVDETTFNYSQVVTTVKVGESGSGNNTEGNMILIFELPSQPAGGFLAADTLLRVTLQSHDVANSGEHADMWAIGYVPAADIADVGANLNDGGTTDVDDFFLSDADTETKTGWNLTAANTVKIWDDLVDNSSTSGMLEAPSATRTTLTSFVNGLFNTHGASAGDYLVLRINYDVDMTNYDDWIFYSGSSSSNQPLLTLTSEDPEGTITNVYTAGDTLVVPAGVSQITIRAWGAGGGGGAGGQSGSGAAGGSGGFAQGTFSVSEGDSLAVLVGGGGGNGAANPGFGAPVGGGGGGGGLSAVSNATTTTILLVAGSGGGGGGGDNGSNDGAAGGAGGGESGVDGTDGVATGFASGATGGTQSAGGSGGISGGGDSYGDDGSAFTGGAGGDGANGGSSTTGGDSNGGSGGGGSGGGGLTSGYPGGGGGGAGYFGGGGGCGATYYNGNNCYAGTGGGGGSSYADASGTNTITLSGGGTLPPVTNNSAYVDGVGLGGTGGAGGGSGADGVAGSNGLVVITYEQILPGSILWSDRDTTNINQNSGWASATVNTGLTDCVLVWDTSDNGTASTNSWPNRLGLGSQSAGAVTAQMTSLSVGQTYVWRLYGTNATTNGWSAATSFGTHGAPTVAADPSADVSFEEATLYGTVTASNGVPLLGVRIYFGTSNGGTDPGAWDTNYVISAGSVIQGIAFSTNVTGLTENRTYYYRVYATNSLGDDWSGSGAVEFATPFEGSLILDFETATAGATPPPLWNVVNSGGNGTYETLSANGNPGQCAELDWTGSDQNSPGAYLFNDGLPFDASASFSGSFDFRSDALATANYDGLNFILGDIRNGLAGDYGEYLNVDLRKATFGNRALIRAGDDTLLFNGVGDNNYSVSPGVWYTAVFSWTPTAGLSGNFSIAWNGNPAVVNGYTFDSTNMFFGFGTGDTPARFDNISISGVALPESPAVAPTLASSDIVDSVGGGPSEKNNAITYTISFNESIETSSFTTNELSNVAGSPAPLTFDSLTQTVSNEFELVVTPTDVGNITMQVSSNVTDLSHNRMSADVSDDTTISIIADSTPPEVTGFVDDQSGAGVQTGTLVTVAVTFNEPIDASTVDVGDFVNASNATIVVNSVNPGTDTNVFTVGVTPTTAGGLRLQLAADKLADISGNTNDVAWTDDTVIPVIASVPGDGTWNTNANGDWSTVANWQSYLIADGTNYTATFGNVITLDRTVTLDSDRTIGNITVLDTSHNYTIAGANTLTLDRTSGSPAISVPSGRTLAINTVIDGSDGLTKTGSGTLQLNGACTYSGDVIVQSGGLGNVDEGSFGASTKVTFAGNSSFGVKYAGYPEFSQEIAVNNGVTLSYSVGNQYRRSHWLGPLTGSGKISFSPQNNGKVYFQNAANTFTGTLQVNGSGDSRLYVNSLADGANPVRLSTCRFYLYTGAASSLVFNQRQIELYGNNTSAVELYNDNGSAATTITINSDLLVTGTGNKTLQLRGGNTGNNTFGGSITNGTGAVISITKDDNGKWVLSGTNTYSGATTVIDGTLVLEGSEALLDSGTLKISSGAVVQMNSREKVGALELGGVPQAVGTYGAVSSGADNESGDFAGTEILYVGVEFPSNGSMFLFR